jgi:hypothetical protein
LSPLARFMLLCSQRAIRLSWILEIMQRTVQRFVDGK